MAENVSLKTECKGSNGRECRMPYATPRLTEFGALQRVTRGTGGTVGDGGAQFMAMSDPAVKENILRIDTHPMGFGLYLFDFKPEHRSTCGYGRQFGVMADEVARVIPEAVSVGPDGFMQVDYGRLGIASRSGMR